jgi:hypothetical protein
VRWYKSAGQYGAWIAPDGTSEAIATTMGHESAARRILGHEAQELSKEQVYDILMHRDYLRIVNGPPMAIECRNFRDQASQILAATAHLPPETQVIMEMWDTQVWPEGNDPATIAQMRSEFAEAPMASDVLGRGGSGDPWRSNDGGFSVYESRKGSGT